MLQVIWSSTLLTGRDTGVAQASHSSIDPCVIIDAGFGVLFGQHLGVECMTIRTVPRAIFRSRDMGTDSHRILFGLGRQPPHSSVSVTRAAMRGINFWFANTVPLLGISRAIQ